MKPLRSVLFTPGNNLRMIGKTLSLNADALILDLEDAVPPADKETARLFVRDSLAELAAAGIRVWVRINGLATGMAQEDLDWIVHPGLAGVVLPKVESAEDIRTLDRNMIQRAVLQGMAPESLERVAVIESALGLLRAFEIASASPRLTAIALGGVDFCRDMGVTPSDDGRELFYPRAALAVAARAAGCVALDTPCVAVNDIERLRRDSQEARQLGFRGKLLIHPSQIAPVNEIFSPSAAEVEIARDIVRTFEEAKKQGLGAVAFQGRMVDEANYRQALDILEQARLAGYGGE